MNPRAKLFYLWAITLMVGAFFAFLYHVPLPGPAGVVSHPVVQSTAIQSSSSSILYIIALVIMMVVSVVLLIKLSQKRNILKVYVLGVIYFSIFFGFFSLIALVAALINIPMPIIVDVVFSILATIFVRDLKARHPNFLPVFLGAIVIAGIAIALPLLWVIILCGILMVYDFVAVLKSNVMRNMVKSLTQVTVTPFAFIAGDASKLQGKLDGTKAGKRSNVALLGLGDAVFPGALLVSVAFSNGSTFPKIAGVTFGAYLGLYLTFYLAHKRKMMLPALPLICGLGLVGLAIGWIV